MSTSRTDDEVVEKLRLLIADRGTEWADNYDLFLIENRTFDAYWPDGVDAIRDNNVHVITFGRACMLKIGRAQEQALFEGQEDDFLPILDLLAIELDAEVARLTKGAKL